MTGLYVDSIKDASNTKTLATLSSSAVSLSSDVDIKSAINASGSAPIYAVRAWVTFNGNQSGTITNHTGGNVTSITVHSTGFFTINFTTALPDANYAVAGAANGNGSGAEDMEVTIDSGTAPTSSACKIFTSSGHKPGTTAGTVASPTSVRVIFVR